MPTVNYTISFSSNVNAVFNPINESVDKADKGMKGLTKSVEECWKQLMSLNLAADAIKNLGSAMDDLSKPGAALNSSMADLQAITGLVGESLKGIERSARQSAKAFGTDAAQNVESYKLLLSQLSPELGKNAKALKMMGDNVNVLSKQMGGDTVAATNVLTTAMNQFGISMDDPMKAGQTMADMMNVMAAAAREGSAELPQIQEALKQVGMMAKTVGVTFSETNAAIQVLDKAGKKGAEGGVALRNVLTSLSQGRFLPKEVQEELQAVGVNINKLTDQTAPLADRLRAIKPIFNDTALMTKMFGRENMASAIALAGQIDELERYNTAIQGTNTAFEQADVIMGSYQEKLKRQSAWWDNLKISIFNATNSFLPFIKGLATIAAGFGTAAYTMSGFSALAKTKFLQSITAGTKALWNKTFAVNANTVAIAQNNRMMGLGGIAAKAYAIGMGLFSVSARIATVAVRGLSTAIYSIPLVGWILAAIAAIIALVKMLWEKSRTFRQILFGTWGALKAVLHNIGVVVKNVWNVIIKPFAQAVIQVFTSVKDALVAAWTSVRDFFVGIWQAITDALVSAWETVTAFFGGIWNWLKTNFSALAGLIQKWIVDPIRNAFNSLWDFIKNIFDKIIGKLTAVFRPIVRLWNRIFSGDFESVTSAYVEGSIEGGEHFDREKAKKNGESEFALPTPETPVIDMTGAPGFQNVVTNNATGKAVGDTSGGGGAGKNITVNINKLVETITLSVTNLKESKEQIKNAVAEALVTAVNDVNLAV